MAASTKARAAPTNIRIEASNERFYAECEFDGARFHVWLNGDGEPDRESIYSDRPGEVTLYKNPPRGTPSNGPGDFRTRKLEAGRGQGKIVFDAMMAQVPALMPAAKQAAADRHAAEGRRLRQIQAAEMARRAGPELLVAAVMAERLIASVPHTSTEGGNSQEVLTVLREAIAKARGQ